MTRTIVVTEQPYFADPVSRHFVEVLESESERHRHRLFFRHEPRRDRSARNRDASGEGPGRYFGEKSLLSHEYDVQHGFAEMLPEHRHASFADFLAAIGYDWTANAYRQVEAETTG